jgi:hypothetical protein
MFLRLALLANSYTRPRDWPEGGRGRIFWQWDGERPVLAYSQPATSPYVMLSSRQPLGVPKEGRAREKIEGPSPLRLFLLICRIATIWSRITLTGGKPAVHLNGLALDARIDAAMRLKNDDLKRMSPRSYLVLCLRQPVSAHGGQTLSPYTQPFFFFFPLRSSVPYLALDDDDALMKRPCS